MKLQFDNNLVQLDGNNLVIPKINLSVIPADSLFHCINSSDSKRSYVIMYTSLNGNVNEKPWTLKISTAKDSDICFAVQYRKNKISDRFYYNWSLDINNPNRHGYTFDRSPDGPIVVDPGWSTPGSVYETDNTRYQSRGIYSLWLTFSDNSTRNKCISLAQLNEYLTLEITGDLKFADKTTYL